MNCTRLTSGVGQAYISSSLTAEELNSLRWQTMAHRIENKFIYQNGSLGINTTSGLGTYKLVVNGDINLIGSGKYRINGQEFTTLPTQTDTTRGAYLVSDGADGAFWAYLEVTQLQHH